ncbi:MAG: RNA polymerase sigma factor [Candidatus Korobacteraceae bacterium]
MQNREQFLSFLQRRVGSAATAEDILQSALLRSIERGGTVRDQERVVPWFYRVLRNAVIDHYRKEGSSEKALEEFANELQAHEYPTEQLENEICRCVTVLLESLKPEYKEALTTVDLEQRRLADLAKNAGISEGNAAVRIHRAREALRKQLRATCGVCAEHRCVDCTCRSRPV